MKAAKWILKDDNAGLVTVLCDNLDNAEEITMLDEPHARFSILRHTINSKRIGYKFEYAPKAYSSKVALFNTFICRYSKKMKVPKELLGVEVIFYDSVVRLFKYQHQDSKIADYLLVGRWRSPAEDSTEEVDNGE
jgi:hypothetical protein